MRVVALVTIMIIFSSGCLLAEEPKLPAQSESTGAIGTIGLESENRGPVEIPQPTEKALSYYRSGNVLYLVDIFWGILISALFLFTGFSAKIRNWAAGLGRKWFFIIGIYIVIFTIINFLIDLPLDFYQSFVREHSYGLSNQTFGKWFKDSTMSLLITLVMGALLAWIPYWLLKKSPRRWWLYAGILVIPFTFVFSLIYPIWISPLFNDFGPMHNKNLEAQILALADRAGIDGGRVFEVNKSVDTKAVNAYVAGFMGTKRIVLWDTIISKLDENELLFVMGHEMGHYVLRHVIAGVLFYSVLILLALYAAHKTAGIFLRKFSSRFGFDQLADIASLPLLILLLNIFSFITAPIGNTYSRFIEHQADQFGLEITQDNYAAATAFVKLQAENLSNPYPGFLYKLWRSSHPPIGERIEYCNTYKPWEKGQELRYEEMFRNPQRKP